MSCKSLPIATNRQIQRPFRQQTLIALAVQDVPNANLLNGGATAPLDLGPLWLLLAPRMATLHPSYGWDEWLECREQGIAGMKDARATAWG